MKHIRSATILFVIAFSLVFLLGFILFESFPGPAVTRSGRPGSPPVNYYQGDMTAAKPVIDERLPEENFLPESAPVPFRMLFTGDIMIDRHVGEKIDKHGFDHLFSAATATRELFKNNFHDLRGGNLEGAVTDSGRHLPPVNAYDFAFHPDRVSRFKDYGFNYFTIANNHLADQGENGIIETRKNLARLGFLFSGCRDRAAGGCSIYTAEISGTRVALAAFSMVYGRLDEDEVLGLLRGAAKDAEILVVNIHWGREYEHAFNSLQRELAHKMAEAGADLIIGHHPHVVQGLEVYRGVPIFYSLGNFIFDQYFSAATQEGLGAEISVSETDMTVNLIPFRSRSGRLSVMEETAKKEFLVRLAGWSEGDEAFKQAITSGTFTLDQQY